jgi:hypothetical protein
MSLFRWIMQASQEAPPGRKTVIVQDQWIVEVDDYGFADVKVRTGDLDGSGEAPGVQLEIEHSGGAIALAMSAREAELLAKALWQGAKQILPHMRLRATRRKLTHERLRQPSPSRGPVAETIELSVEEADLLVALIKEHGDEQLGGVLAQIEVPF